LKGNRDFLLVTLRAVWFSSESQRELGLCGSLIVCGGLDYLAANLAIASAFTFNRKLFANPQTTTVKKVPDVYRLRRVSVLGQEPVTSTSRAPQKNPWSASRHQDLARFQDGGLAGIVGPNKEVDPGQALDSEVTKSPEAVNPQSGQHLV
jgi:hypothetical protein